VRRLKRIALAAPKPFGEVSELNRRGSHGSNHREQPKMADLKVYLPG